MKLCDTAENYGVRLQFFQIANGLEVDEVVSHVQEIIRRGHAVDCHTYSHMNLTVNSTKELDKELKLANQLFEKNLGFRSIILRGPGGYRHGDLKPENQQVILDNGFRCVSGEFDYEILKQDYTYFISAPSRNLPFAYPTGLIEVPFQGWTDRTWFDTYKLKDAEAYARWRKEYGHRPVPKGWNCPWTQPDALNEWIKLNLACLDYAYEHRLLWVVCWHPYSHYLHDPQNKMLPALLEAASNKPEKVWICTLRDVLRYIVKE
jgi:peptidoglycan/xylan/chitin deacetylase (PgdA/CDA1 family)